MARIAISLCGEGRGQAARICTLVERLGGGNDFLIATTTEALEFLRGRCGGRGDVRFIELPGIRFRYVGDQLDVSRTVLDGFRFRALELPALVERMVRELDHFAPDLAITSSRCCLALHPGWGFLSSVSTTSTSSSRTTWECCRGTCSAPPV